MRFASILQSFSVAAALLAGAASPAHAEAGYAKGFFLKADDGDKSYALVINGAFQTRFTLTVPEAGDDSYAFDVVRARISLNGHVLSKALTYSFLADFGHGDTQLKDLYIDYAPIDALRIRVGQWKRPFSRPFMGSSNAQQLVDEALTDAAFGVGRDLGLALHNGYEQSPVFEWVVGLFNGTGEKPWYTGKVAVTGDSGTLTSASRTNVPSQFRPLLVARVGYNYGDAAGEGYSEPDLHPEKGLRFSVAAGAMADLGGADRTGAAELDFILKISGFAATGGGFVRVSTDPGSDANPVYGVNLQAGYVLGGRVEPALRFARVMPSDDTQSTLQELALGLNLYFAGQTFKLATDVAALGAETGGASTTEWRVRTQLQTVF